MTDWQPIETAPLDGTVVDVWGDGRRWANLNWNDGNWRHSYWSLGRPANASKVHLRSNVYPSLNPTHWMPLPEPPSE